MWEPQRGLLFSGADIRGCYLVQRANKPTKKGQLILFLCEWTYLASVDIHLHTSTDTHTQWLGDYDQERNNHNEEFWSWYVPQCSLNSRAESSLGIFEHTLSSPPSTLFLYRDVGYGNSFPSARLFSLFYNFLFIVLGLLFRSGSIAFLGVMSRRVSERAISWEVQLNLLFSSWKTSLSWTM